MYEAYFNLAERPFASVPRSDHYYPAGVIDAARNNLTRTIERGEGVGLVIGPPGSGKSLLCRVLADHFHIHRNVQVALLSSLHLDTRRTLLQAILYGLNRPWRGMDEGELRLSLVDYFTLSDDCAEGTVLLVDDAQHLPLRLLGEFRALTNLTRAQQPAVRLVLAGSHILEERFASPKLDSFSQRISARCYLEAFRSDETQAYIWARIMVSGGRGSELFPMESCRMVHKATGGVPRLVNQVCDHVLLMAYAAGVQRIESAHVEEAWADLQQLPTPWNESPTLAAGAEPSAQPASYSVAGGVIEFGGLDDAPAEEAPPIAGKIMAAVPEPSANNVQDVDAVMAAFAKRPGDGPADRQLEEIQRLLADVRVEFEPPADEWPEVELSFRSPHPFAEPFEQEEVIVQRPAAASAHVAPPAEPPVREMKAAAADRLSNVTPARVDQVADDPRERSVVPPPKKELSRLFATMRRGL